MDSTPVRSNAAAENLESMTLPTVAVQAADESHTGVIPGRDPQVDLSPETIKRAGDALFVLWLKIGASLLVARLVVLIWPVVVLLVLSLMLVATFNPLVRILQRRLTRGKAISVVVFGFVSSIAGLLAIMIPPLLRQAQNLLKNMPHYINQLEAASKKMGIKLNLHGSQLDMSHHAANLGPGTINAFLTVFDGVMGLFTVAVLTTYLLIDGQRVTTGALGLLPRHQRLLVRQMFGEIGVRVGDYMRGQLITSVLAGIFSYVVLLALGVPEPLALGFTMAVADAIPLVGLLIGTVPAMLMALTIGSTPAIIVLITYVLYHQLESHILVPRIYGKTLKMSPSIVIISILVGATLLGILGALLALPVAAAIPVVYRYVEAWRMKEEEKELSAEGHTP